MMRVFRECQRGGNYLSVHPRCIVKTSGFTRGVCKNRGFFIKLKGFSCGIAREQAILRKSKAPRKSPEKWTFLGLAFYNAPRLHTVKKSQGRGKITTRPLPQTFLDPPPPMTGFPPSLPCPVMSLQIPLSEASKIGFGGRAL